MALERKKVSHRRCREFLLESAFPIEDSDGPIETKRSAICDRPARKGTVVPFTP